MKEEGQVKIGLGMVVCILLIFALTVACGGLYYFGFVDKKETTVATSSTLNSEVEKKDGVEEKAETTSETEEKKVGKIDESKELIYSSFNKEKVNIPYINIKSDTIEMINDEINEKYKETIEFVNNQDKNYIPHVEYKYYINNQILSLVITRYGEVDDDSYDIYNIDLNTGKTVSNLDLIHSKNLSESEYLGKIKSVYEAETNKYDKNKAKLSNSESMGSFLNGLKEQSCSINTPMYLDENGNITVATKVCTFAGGPYYYHLLKVE